MIRINLLPFRAARKRENVRIQISVYVLSVVLLILCLGASFISLNSKLSEVKNKNAELQKELASYSDMLKQMDELKKKRDDLKSKLDVIQGLEAKRSGPVQLFDEIAMAVPKGKLSLKSLGETGDKVTMAGIAKDYDTVALFMTNLENTNTIGTVTLGATNITEVEAQKISNFNLTCLKQPVDAATAQKANVK
ncbi:Fimbrial assembly protein [uncultured Desulfobacterium sp.]|uniref:Fimbrial assembly protein n=1 Tax=uncultured Desulfobacterium sp. TaxID=201089 RepID=A0A445MXI2_9BACT|nr:Fimbrial assembly protein [uncultured Desulfobacterium sp.]